MSGSRWPSQPADPESSRGGRPGQDQRATPTSPQPPLRSHKSFSCIDTGPSAYPHHQSDIATPFNDANVASYPVPTASRMEQAPFEQPTGMSFGGSAPVSPATQHMSSTAEDSAQDLDEEDSDSTADADEADLELGARGMTAAERLAEKRRMKRFRLSHNQTRFLMSEFARQPHPDAAQRQRLSREIPGLSPRQVQVWFQNRRAKLKRLTTDSDRESLIASRALPEDFDRSHILKSSYSQPYSPHGPSPTRVAPLSTYPATSDAAVPTYYNLSIKPESAPAALGRFPYLSPPGVWTDPFGPASPASAPLLAASQHIPDRPRSSSSSVGFVRSRTAARLQRMERVSSTPAEQAGPTMAFTGNLDFATLSPGIASPEMSSQPQQDLSISFAPGVPPSHAFAFAQEFVGQRHSSLPEIESLAYQSFIPESDERNVPYSATLPPTLLAFARPPHEQQAEEQQLPAFVPSQVHDTAPFAGTMPASPFTMEDYAPQTSRYGSLGASRRRTLYGSSPYHPAAFPSPTHMQPQPQPQPQPHPPQHQPQPQSQYQQMQQPQQPRQPYSHQEEHPHIQHPQPLPPSSAFPATRRKRRRSDEDEAASEPRKRSQTLPDHGGADAGQEPWGSR